MFDKRIKKKKYEIYTLYIFNMKSKCKQLQ